MAMDVHAPAGINANLEGGVIVIRIPVRIDAVLEEAVFRGLSAREQEVFGLLMRRKCNKDIASELGIEVRTAKFHVMGIFRKLGVESRAELWFRYAHLGGVGT